MTENNNNEMIEHSISFRWDQIFMEEDRSKKKKKQLLRQNLFLLVQDILRIIFQPRWNVTLDSL